MQTLHTYQDNSYRAMRTMAVSPDGKTLAVGSSHNDGNIQFWDLATGTLRKALHGSSGSIKDMVFSHDGNSLATAWFDSTVRHYNPVTGELCAPEVFHTQRFLTMAYSQMTGSLLLNVLMGSSRSDIRQQRDYRLFWKATLIVTLTILTFHALQHFHVTVVFLPTCLILIQQLGQVFILALTLLAERE